MANLQPFDQIIDRWRQAGGTLDEDTYNRAVIDFAALVDAACWESITLPEVRGGLSVYSATVTVQITEDMHGQLTRWYDDELVRQYGHPLWWVWLYLPPERMRAVRARLGAEDAARMLIRGRTWLNGGEWEEPDFPLPTGKLGRELFIAGWEQPLKCALATIVEGQLPLRVHQQVVEAKDTASRRLQGIEVLPAPRERLVTSRRVVDSGFLRDWSPQEEEEEGVGAESSARIRTPSAVLVPAREHISSGPPLAQQVMDLSRLRDEYIAMRIQAQAKIDEMETRILALVHELDPAHTFDGFAAAVRFATPIVGAMERGMPLKLAHGSLETVQWLGTFLAQLHQEQARLQVLTEVIQRACAAVGGHEYAPLAEAGMRCVHCLFVAEPVAVAVPERSGT
jgi:hypothetical protein